MNPFEIVTVNVSWRRVAFAIVLGKASVAVPTPEKGGLGMDSPLPAAHAEQSCWSDRVIVVVDGDSVTWNAELSAVTVT